MPLACQKGGRVVVMVDPSHASVPPHANVDPSHAGVPPHANVDPSHANVPPHGNVDLSHVGVPIHANVGRGTLAWIATTAWQKPR